MFQDANDHGLGVFLIPFSGLQPMGLFEEEESRVMEERQSQLCRTLAPALCRWALSLALCTKHASITLCIRQICVNHILFSFWVPRSLSNSYGSLSASTATHDSFHQEMEFISSPLELGILCDLLRPAECGRSDTMPVPILGLKMPLLSVSQNPATTE